MYSKHIHASIANAHFWRDAEIRNFPTFDKNLRGKKLNTTNIIKSTDFFSGTQKKSKTDIIEGTYDI